MANSRNQHSNAFGQQLEYLLMRANIKSATVAAALNYDVSYISKWITGKALPSRKNVDNVVQVISEVIVSHAKEDMLQSMADHYGITNNAQLQHILSETLWDSYTEATGEINEKLYLNNSSLHIAPRGNMPLMDDFFASAKKENPINLIVAADIFALDHMSKLLLAGIDSGHFRLDGKKEHVNVDYILRMNNLCGDAIYDVILLIHMMTNFSHCRFQLFCGDWAGDKLIIAQQDETAGISILAEDHRFLSTTLTRDKRAVNELYDLLRNMADPDKLVFSNTDMKSMLLNRAYFHNLLAQNSRWLVGHITEHFVPQELFYQLLEQCFDSDPVAAGEAERAYLLSDSELHRNHIKIMLYYLALVDFALSGELDFFNNKVILSSAQRKQVLLHFRQLLDKMDADNIKLVKEGFSEDFKYITNPCIFLSDSAPYLRLENKLYANNLLQIKDESVRKVLDVFFESIWNDNKDRTISDHNTVAEKLDTLIDMVSSM